MWKRTLLGGSWILLRFEELERTWGEEMSVIDAPDVDVPLSFVVPDSWDAYLAKDDGAVR